MKSKVKGYIFPVLAVLTVSAFPSLFLYCRNADEAGFSEIVPALLISVAAGLVLFGLAVLFTRNPGKAAISASLLMLVILNFTFLENGLKLILPRLKYWHTVPIILVVALHIIYFLCRFLKNETAGDVTKILCLVFGGLIVLNVATSTPQIINHVKYEHKQSQRNQDSTHTEGESDLPNVYMFIFDEYANFPQMEEYYHYKNTSLRDFLEKNQFSICIDGHNESIGSSTVQTNLVNLDYLVTNATSESEKTSLRKNGYLFSLLERNGYNIQIFEAGSFYGGHMPDGEKGIDSGAVTINGENLQDLFLKQCILYPFRKQSQDSGESSVANRITKLADYLSGPNNLPEAGTFTLSYFSFPHQPFQVDENGAPIPIEHWEDWENDSYYLGQYKFATKQMLRILENIVKNDPGAVVIAMSDHGARSGVSTSSAQKFTLNYMNNAFNAVRFPGDEPLNIEGLSLVNTMRMVCNKLLGTDYEMVEVPEDNWDYYWGGGELNEGE